MKSFREAELAVDPLHVSLERCISEAEAAVVSWLLKNVTFREFGEDLLRSVHRLRVVGCCPCGCASVEFEEDRGPGTQRRIAKAIGVTPAGRRCRIILWGREDAVTGLELHDLDPGGADVVPPVETLRPWGMAGSC